jgi:hypothetical protein
VGQPAAAAVLRVHEELQPSRQRQGTGVSAPWTCCLATVEVRWLPAFVQHLPKQYDVRSRPVL